MKTQLDISVELVMKAIRESGQDQTALLKQLKKANKRLEFQNNITKGIYNVSK